MTAHIKAEVLLKAENVNLSLCGKPILRDINFSIKNIVRPGMQQGQVVSLIGRSGIGKTQLFRILSGLQKPDAGQILVRGYTGPSDEESLARYKPWTLRPVHAGDMGVIFQNYYQFGW